MSAWLYLIASEWLWLGLSLLVSVVLLLRVECQP